ncbi:hypothetical protein HMPREF9370_0557 [Neisseria wadsworthii 9715]|uniref:Uncharacterized protein n=1 Tax=Neisseria wadsworthii 9715 TaxID=1030841 RepID=G4CN98_9NEIS|nr:hypothetical protein HMPREF9370_0557 [Neisseria wadsworthii 9715]
MVGLTVFQRIFRKQLVFVKAALQSMGIKNACLKNFSDRHVLIVKRDWKT